MSGNGMRKNCCARVVRAAVFDLAARHRGGNHEALERAARREERAIAAVEAPGRVELEVSRTRLPMISKPPKTPLMGSPFSLHPVLKLLRAAERRRELHVLTTSRRSRSSCRSPIG